jgi:glucokinase
MAVAFSFGKQGGFMNNFFATPEVVVIGGGVSKAGSILIESIQKHFVETSFHACRNTKFVSAGLGNDAGMYGCVQMLLD